MARPPEDLENFSYLKHSVPSFSMLLDPAKLKRPPTPSPSPPPQPMSKRHHALHELLSSERAYASDLALIRDVHIPLALGHTVPLPLTPPDSSNSSARTLSTASDPPSGSAPMSPEDVKLVFGNILQLALFSDQFSEQLESALGDILPGGQGPDRVGALFLDTIPIMEPPYREYITRHSSAAAHLTTLPQTPALVAYIAQTQNIAASLSHAWDIASLLIKPVQRLLKYPLLLAAIIDETPDSHPDKPKLKAAMEQMQQVARGVNEGKRRREVVKDVLSGKRGKSVEGERRRNMNVGTAAGVSLTKVKGNLRTKPLEDNEEAIAVARMEAELRRIDAHSEQLAKSVLEWTKGMADVLKCLNQWAAHFGHVIGLSEDQGSEAFDAFMMVVNTQLLPLCNDLDVVVREMLLVNLARLRNTREAPLKLIMAMKDQEPAHLHLLTMNVSPKNRPDPALLQASQNYLALRGQLAAELPVYLSAYHRGLAACTLQLASIQAQFWADVRDRWSSLWDALRVEGEKNAGADETVAVWWSRWNEVDRYLAELAIVQPPKIRTLPIGRQASGASGRRPSQSSKDLKHVTGLDPSPYHYEQRSSTGSSTHVVHNLHLLDPHRPEVSSPQPLAPRRGRGNSDASRKTSDSRKSNDSLKSPTKLSKKAHPAPPPPRPDSFGEYVDVILPSMPRTKSMPFEYEYAPPMQPSTSTSSRKTVPEDVDRGRTPPPRRNPMSRKMTDSVVPSATSTRTRSPPAKSRPRRSIRDEWLHAPARYECQVIHPCEPPPDVAYRQLPFFTLQVDDVLSILQEVGHPSLHEGLPLHIDDGEDCLLLARDERGEIGWALASFLIPLD